VPYDLQLADRIRAFLRDEDGVTEKRMFGGLAFLVGGRLAVAASGRGGLLVRVAPDDAEDRLGEPGVEPFLMRGREVGGWLLVDVGAVATDEGLAEWVTLGVDHARSQPPRG